MTVTHLSPFTARLSPHFQLGELALWSEARRFRHPYQLHTALTLVRFLERVRSQFGGRPVKITSGYRPPEVNRAIGGAASSEHLYSGPGIGAVDFNVPGVSTATVQAWCDAQWAHSLGYGAARGFVHLGIRAGGPRVRWNY